MQQSSDSTVRSHADNVSEAAAALETIRRHSLKERLLRPVQRHPTIALVLAVYIALAFLCGGLLWLTPISVLRINEALKPFPAIKLPGSLGGIEVSLPNLVLIGFFHYHARVLEAWVRRNIDPARAAFESSGAPESNTGTLELPVSLDGSSLPTALSAHSRGQEPASSSLERTSRPGHAWRARLAAGQRNGTLPSESSPG
jgi:hypothetical protein